MSESEKFKQAEAFVGWMLLEAKASREGMPVDPRVEQFALLIDDHFRRMARGMMEIARKGKP